MGRIRALRECFGEFCQSTTIQGFQSFGDPNKHWLFRLAWLFITISSFTTAGIFIYGSFQGLTVFLNISQAGRQSCGPYGFHFFISCQQRLYSLGFCNPLPTHWASLDSGGMLNKVPLIMSSNLHLKIGYCILFLNFESHSNWRC